MKRYFMMLTALLSCCPLIHAQAIMKFDTTLFDFGEIAKGSAANAAFYFTNTGDEPLLIQNVNSSCGCLVPYWNKEPVAPGNCGMILGHYDSNRIGIFEKTLTVTSSVGQTLLYLKGTVRNDTTLALTTFKVSDTLLSLGKMSYGAERYLSVRIENTGNAPLYFYLSSVDPKSDPMFVALGRYEGKITVSLSRIAGPGCGGAESTSSMLFTVLMKPGESRYISFFIKNNSGNSGDILRHFTFQANATKRNFVITIKTKFTDTQHSRTETIPGNGKSYTEYKFLDGKLVHYAYYDEKGELFSEMGMTDTDITLINHYRSPLYHERHYDKRTGVFLYEK